MNRLPKIALSGLIVLFLLSLTFCQSRPRAIDEITEVEGLVEGFQFPAKNEPLPVSTFNEVWAYVVADREAALVPGLPITDVLYFGAEVNTFGRLINVPNRANLHPFDGRVHLVIKIMGYPLTHFTLMEGTPVRRQFITDVIAAAQGFDGLNINIEMVPHRSQSSIDAYLSFLKEVRAGIPSDMIFSIALPARTRALQGDPYDFATLEPLADRFFVMAYDHHWSGGPPGPIAGMNWSRQVAQHSINVIGTQRIVMGLPFYGRTWGDYRPSRALIYSQIERIINEHGIKEIRRSGGIPTFNYTRNVNITVYFEDVYSLASRMSMFKAMGLTAVGFWRLGQETSEVWNYIRLAN